MNTINGDHVQSQESNCNGNAVSSKRKAGEQHLNAEKAKTSNEAGGARTLPDTYWSFDESDYCSECETDGDDDDDDETDGRKKIPLPRPFLASAPNTKSTIEKNWFALQHYIYYIYRHIVSCKPMNNTEILSELISKKIRSLIERCIHKDRTQFFMRLVMLLREYSLVTRGHNDRLKNSESWVCLNGLMAYYNAFCSAANILSPLLREFEALTMERFSVTWLYLNKSIFYHYVYKSATVQSKLPLFQKLRERNKPAHRAMLDSYSSFCEDMNFLASRWATLKLTICNLAQSRTRNNAECQLENERKMFGEHKKILESRSWLVRPPDAIALQDRRELDAHILAIVGDRSLIADFHLDSLGNCLCDDCMSAEFRATKMPPPYDENNPEVYHLIGCYICEQSIMLKNLTVHINTKHNNRSVQTTKKIYSMQRKKQCNHKKNPSCDAEPSNVVSGASVSKNLSGTESPNDGSGDSGSGGTSNSSGASSSCHISNDNVKGSIASSNSRCAVNGYGAQESSPQVGNSSENEDIKNSMVKIVNINTNLLQSGKSEPPELTVNTPDHKLKLKSPCSSWNLNTKANALDSKGTCPMPVKEPMLKVTSEAAIGKSNTETTMKSNTLKTVQNVHPPKVRIKKVDEGTQVRIGKTDSCVNTDLLNKKLLESAKKHSELLSNKNKAFFPEIDVPKKTEITSTNSVNASKVMTDAAFRKPQLKSISVDQRVGELFKPTNSQKASSATPKRTNITPCHGPTCNHQCKSDTDTDNNTSKSELERLIEAKKHFCQDSCDYHKDSRKCDCAYCEVFGASLPSHTHKTNETRDRLRTRLNQRKEKDKVAATKLDFATHGKSEIDNGPPRVPEVVHVVPPPSNKKSVLTTAEAKKLQSMNSRDKTVSSRSTMTLLDVERNGNEVPCRSLSSLSISSLNSDNIDSRDINELLNYIEGNKKVNKAALAQKKADKKARQRIKKAQIKERVEKEKQLKEEARLMEEAKLKEAKLKEEKLKEEERLQAEAEKQKKIKKEMKKNKKPKNNAKEGKTITELIETIPAMVTIKRVAEGNDTPATVTITLKGSTPESDELLFTLVKGYNDNDHVATATINGDRIKKDVTLKEKIIPSKREKEKEVKNAKKKKSNELFDIASKELKVTIALGKKNSNKKDHLNKKETSNKKNVKGTENITTQPTFLKSNKEVAKKTTLAKSVTNISKTNMSCKSDVEHKNDVDIHMLRLPPGITITKIEGPPTNKNNKNSSHSSNGNTQNTNVPVSKSGVIVVDTEKLIQQSITATNNKKNKKNKKKRNAKSRNGSNESFSNNTNGHAAESSMVTLKNPIFHSLQGTISNTSADNNDLPVYRTNRQASIFKNENGMVTIRSPRLQNNFENGSPISNFLTDLKPMFRPETSNAYTPLTHASHYSENKLFNAQELLSGLPGIEITKVDKTNSRPDSDSKRGAPPAEVSIIPTGNGNNSTDKFNFDRDDWPFESVFTPKDVLEDDMDAEERELEAFKRFCQQSVPPKRKEKVAHLNVKDIILKKKNDITS